MTVIIPNYNGSDLLARYLPGIAEEVGAERVLVIDDGSTDGSVNLLREKFARVGVISRAANGGFSAAANEGIRASTGELVILLNNDVEVTPGFLGPLKKHFEDERVFAVSPRILLPSKGGIDEGAKTGFWHHGLFYTGQAEGLSRTAPILYATGCAAVYRRSMLEALGGFDVAYSPFYWEDVDLCYRAWKRGWKTLYEPASVVYHQHSASISRWPKAYTDAVKARNSLLFIWRNIEDEVLARRHRLWLPLVLARRLAAGDVAFVRGWLQARALKRDAASARGRDGLERKLSDRDIFRAANVSID